MGISFKVSKNGRRFRPKPLPLRPGNSSVTTPADGADDVISVRTSKDTNRIVGKTESTSMSTPKPTVDFSERDKDASETSETEVSFTLSLFPDGYSIGNPPQFQGESGHQLSAEVPKYLHPYDRASESLFSAIESGRLPGDILDDIPCKYTNGMLVCEVRDYRKCFSEAGVTVPSAGGSPIINRVCLRMSLENVVKDIQSISDSGWTYGDLMEVESRIVKALQPKLCLDPTPVLDRLGENPTSTPNKLNLSLSSMRRKRLKRIPEVTVTSNNSIHGKKVCIERAPEGSRFGDSGPTLQQPIHDNLQIQNNGPNSILALRPNSFGPNASVPSSPLVSQLSKYQMGIGSPRYVQDHSGSHPGQDMIISYSDNMSSGAASFHGRRDNQETQSNSNKRSRLTAIGAHGNQPQIAGSQMESFHGSDSHWKNTLLQQQSRVQYATSGMQKYPQQIFDGGLNQEAGAVTFSQGMRYGLKEEPVETERWDKSELGQTRNEMHTLESELNQTDSSQSRLQQRLPQQLVRSNFAQTSWNNLNQPLESNSRKEDPYHKRKLVQSPHVSAGGIPQSPLSSKSGEFSSGSVGPQVGAAVTSGYISSQKEKPVITSVSPIGCAASLTSSANDSMQRQHQAQIAAKRRSNSLPKTPAMSGVGSPASVNNMSMPINASSPVGTPPLADPVIIDRFSKIDMVTARFQLNCKKSKVDEFPMTKTNVFPAQQLSVHLSNDSSNENFKDESCKMPLSTSLAGGNMNVCKTRVLNFMLTERIVQANGYSIVPKARTRLIMSEKPNDGTVAIHIGEIEDAQYLAAEDYLPTLPNTHTADLLAAQFCSLMIREGYLVEDLVQTKPIPTTSASSNQPSAPGVAPNNPAEMQQYPAGVSGPPSNDSSKPSSSGALSLNPSNSLQASRMLSPANVQGLHISQGLLPGASIPSRPQQPELIPTLQQQQLQSQQQQQQQHPQFQRSPLMLAANSMLNTMGQNSNMQMGNHMANKPSPLQLQMLQQQQQQLQPQQQQQQQQQMQRKMMMSLGTVGMGNMANNMVGLGGLGSVMGMAGVRGVGGAGISAPMPSIAGMSNLAQNPMNLSPASNISNTISQQLRSGALTPQQAAAMQTKLRMAQNRVNMLSGSQSNISGITGPQSSISGISGPQSSISGLTGARQMHAGAPGLSMLGPALSRGNLNPMQRTMGQMGPPKLMTGMTPYMTQPQQQLQLQQLQLQQQQQQLQQQQETASPLQAVVSPPQVGSPPNIGMPQQINQQTNQQQQQASPQQMSQRTPMSPQLSSGAIHTMSTGNPEACPASPQLSSQTLGSVNSIANSPMELQGVNKSNSVNNA